MTQKDPDELGTELSGLAYSNPQFISRTRKEEIKSGLPGSEEMAQQLRALAALAEDLGLTHSTHMAAPYTSGPRGSNTLFWLPGALQ